MNISKTARRDFSFLSILSRLTCLMAIVALCWAQASADEILDQTFGIRGEAKFEGSAFALQPDGKIVAAGWLDTNSSQGFFLRRYHADGKPDLLFGNRSRVVTDPTPLTDIATCVAIQPDGKIVVGGYSYIYQSAQPLILVRYHADGSLDNSFGQGGISLVHNAQVYAINGLAIQADGKIVVVGNGRRFAVETCDGAFVVARYTTTGQLDRTFARGTNDQLTGIALLYNTYSFGTHCDSHMQLRSVSISPDGKILIGGSFLSTIIQSYFVIGQLSSKGKLEFLHSYRDGRDESNDSGFSFVQKLPNGKIVAIGTKVARFLDGGGLDPTFAPNAQLETAARPFLNGRGAVLPDGSVVHTRRFITPSIYGDTQFSLLNGDGYLMSYTLRQNYAPFIHTVLAQPDGKYIIISDKARRYLIL